MPTQIQGGFIADGSVDSSEIATSGVITNDIADGAVTTAKLADSSVTTAKLASASALVPIGAILMWSGSTIPSGYALCNGENGTPDLRDRFIVGSGTSYNIGNTGGANTVTLTDSQMPYHTHTDSGHTHPFTGAQHPSGNGPEQNQSGSPEDRTNFNYPRSTGTGYANLSYAGGLNGVTQAHENRPPYFALAFIMRIS